MQKGTLLNPKVAEGFYQIRFRTEEIKPLLTDGKVCGIGHWLLDLVRLIELFDSAVGERQNST